MRGLAALESLRVQTAAGWQSPAAEGASMPAERRTAWKNWVEPLAGDSVPVVWLEAGTAASVPAPVLLPPSEPPFPRLSLPAVPAAPALLCRRPLVLRCCRSLRWERQPQVLGGFPAKPEQPRRPLPWAYRQIWTTNEHSTRSCRPGVHLGPKGCLQLRTGIQAGQSRAKHPNCRGLEARAFLKVRECCPGRLPSQPCRRPSGYLFPQIPKWVDHQRLAALPSEPTSVC
mmetsp:Transcript_68637/g.143338  ORF Transcript_68637/g.143338 Transcript_68637/m.143338 type:complete len:229 (-) Transcript_68637:787-1473(-)